MKLRDLVKKFDANGFVLADDGNGSANSDGEFVEWTEETADEYGDTELQLLDSWYVLKGGVECLYGSQWIIDGAGDNPYRYRIYF